MQHQLACTGLNLALYFSFDGYKGHIVEVKRDNDFINDMMKQEEKFWETIKDYVGAKNE
jgi:predicted phage-related endonuclease